MNEAKRKRDYLIYTLFFQFLVCALLFGALYGLREVNSDVFLTVKEEYFEKLGENNLIVVDEQKDEELDEAGDTAETSATEKIKSENTDNTEKPEEKETLSAEISQEPTVSTTTESPDNVSVNSYVLSQKMVLPVSGEITSEFGERVHPITSEDKFHAGIDIAAESGTPIYSAFDGTVVVADYDQWNGNYMKIMHEGDIMTVYCHCEKLNVSKGDTVKAGDVIGFVGSTGSSTGPHLHFELRIGNVSYNPQTALLEAINAV